MTAKGDWGKVLNIIERSLGLGSQPYVLFSLAVLSEVAMFSLFQCFSIFQHSRLFIIYISDKGCHWSSVYFLLARDNVRGC
jgi:hypothetical protein